MANWPHNTKRQGPKPTPRSNPGVKKVNHNNGTRKGLRAIRQAEAKERNAAWAALTPVEQLKLLNEWDPAGSGAKRQRKRLAAALKKAA